MQFCASMNQHYRRCIFTYKWYTLYIKSLYKPHTENCLIYVTITSKFAKSPMENRTKMVDKIRNIYSKKWNGKLVLYIALVLDNGPSCNYHHIVLCAWALQYKACKVHFSDKQRQASSTSQSFRENIFICSHLREYFLSDAIRCLL